MNTSKGMRQKVAEMEKSEPEIVVSSKALEKAEEWVRKMTGGDSGSDSAGEEPSAGELEARPPRLGLGAKYLPHSQVAKVSNPVERKLRAMASAGKRLKGQNNPYKQVGSRSGPEESKSDAEDDSDEDEVKGSSGILHGRQQRRVASEDLLSSPRMGNKKGKKRRR